VRALFPSRPALSTLNLTLTHNMPPPTPTLRPNPNPGDRTSSDAAGDRFASSSARAGT
jgi:hypothetical protein